MRSGVASHWYGWIYASKLQRPGRLHLRQRAHLGEHLGRQFAINLDQRNRIAARRLPADMERRNVDPRLPERRGEAADEARLVEIGDVDHRGAELGVHADALDVHDARAPISKD